jgi:hypothetical protein
VKEYRLWHDAFPSRAREQADAGNACGLDGDGTWPNGTRWAAQNHQQIA